MIGFILLLCILFFFVFYGYHLLANKRSAQLRDDAAIAACHLCKRKFPISTMVGREKDAGFHNYFCGDCIEQLYADYTALARKN